MKLNIKNLLAYLFIVAVAVLFMLFLDGPGGSYLLIALTTAFILSFALFRWTASTISARITVSEDILNKGDNVNIKVVLNKRGVIPTAFVNFSFSCSVHFSSEGQKDFCTVIFGQDEYSVEKSFASVFFGSAYAGVDGIFISDYFGIFTYSLALPELRREIRIYPDIPEVSGRDNFARSLTDAVSFDDNEETSQSMVSINGVPGYDHRKYVPGDNLKLINWKLSAKRGELLVRQLEGTGGAEQVFVLVRDDLYFEESQFAAEAMLGLMMIFAKAELPVRAVIYINDSWQEFSVRNVPELSQLRYKMTDYFIFPLKRYCEDNKCPVDRNMRKIAVPDSVEGDRAVVFAPVYDENLRAFTDRLTALGKDCQTAVCSGEITDKNTKRIVRDNLSVRFTD